MSVAPRSTVLTNSATASQKARSRRRGRSRRRRQNVNASPPIVSLKLDPVKRATVQKRLGNFKSAMERTMSRTDRSEYLDKYSPYFRSIKDPFRHTGAKIPDATCYPSSTFSVTFRWTTVTQLSTNGANPGVDHYAGFALDSLSPERTLLIAAGLDDATKAIKWVPFPGTTYGEVPQIDEIKKLYRLVRPVSAGLCIMRDMSSLNDQGVITSVCAPTETPQVKLGPNPPLSRYSLAEDPQYSNFTNLQQAFTAVQSPVRDGGALGIYRPADPSCHEYTSIQYDPTANEDNFALPYYGGIIMFVNGTAPSVPITFVVRINYEAVPFINSFSLVSPSPSPRDSQELDEVINHVQTVPAVVAGPNAVKPAQETASVGVTHGNQKPAPQGSFLSRVARGLLSGVRTVAPLIEALI